MRKPKTNPGQGMLRRLSRVLRLPIPEVRKAFDSLCARNAVIRDSRGRWIVNEDYRTWKDLTGRPQFDERTLRFIETGKMPGKD
jgi:hypothetical protein